MNQYTGARSALKFEGIIISISDDFEGGGRSDFAYVEVGGAVSSCLDLYGAYFELKRNTHPVKAIRVNNSGSVSIRDCRAYGDVNDPDSIFMSVDVPGRIHVSASLIARFATVFSGVLLASSDISIFGTRYMNYTTLQNWNIGDITTGSVFCVWPDDKIGILAQ